MATVLPRGKPVLPGSKLTSAVVPADLVIRGGLVIDGTGAPGFHADVAVEHGSIVAIGDRCDGRRTLAADGRVVAPGFIDIHTHYDAQVFWDPGLTPSSWHGVTTVVAGNCGFSLAPLRAEHQELMIETLENVEDMLPDTLRAGVDWSAFGTYGDYLDAVERRGVRINFGGYVGHTAVRLWVLGTEASERPATPQELTDMRWLVAEAMDAGALGFATSFSPSHRGAGGRPVPSRLADMDELLALLAPLRDSRRGVVAMLPGERVTIPDVYEVQRAVGRPLTWTPMLVMRNYPHEQLLAANDAARRAGQDVWAQTAVRPIVFQETLRSPFVLNSCPAIAALTGAGDDVRASAFADRAWRRRLGDDVASRSWVLADITVADSSSCPSAIGRSLDDLAAELGNAPLDVMLDLALADGFHTRFSIPVANADPAAVAPLLRADGVLLGLGDGGAHVGQLCDSCYPTDLLGRWVRDRGVLTLEAAVRKLTGEPAAFLGLADRGRLAPGRAADICVFDPATVAPGRLRRVRDLPAGGERLVADAGTGICHVIVNGTPVRVDGEEIDPHRRPGNVLRGSS
jgi:N-acyl-D-aspartate/D-glutamate deacylase